MKRGGPLRRTAPLRGDPAKAKAWQARQQPLARSREASTRKPLERSAFKQSRPRRNDSGWKAEVHQRYGYTCVSCGARRDVQADHIWPRSQGGRSDVENGLPLCGSFSDTGLDCHGRKTANTMLIRHEWLQPEQVAYLAAVGWVTWDEQGQPHGRGWKHFAPIAGASTRRVE